MQMDSRLILGGVQPDVANALAGGVAAGQAVRQAQTQNALADLYRTQGAAIMSGDQNALNALAQISPEAALGIQNSRQVMDARAQDMGFASRRMEILNAQEARQIEEYAATKTAAERAAEAAQIEDAVKMGMMIQSPEQWDQVMATQAPDLVGQFANRDALAGKYMTMAEILKQSQGDPAAVTQGAPQGYMWANPQDRTQGVVPIQGYQAAPADEYGRYAAEETKAGRTPLDRIGYEQAKKGKGFSVTTADGTTVQYGGPVGGGAPDLAGQTMGADALVADVDAILNDPNLPNVLGPIMGSGGNNIDELPIWQRGVYGGEGTALVERIGNLQNKTWLAAREMLKGGGAITDFESKKAEGAMARMSRAKGEKEFRDALTDFKDAVVEGQKKLDAARGVVAPADLSDDDLLKKYGG